MAVTVTVNGNSVANGALGLGGDQLVASGQATDAVVITTDATIIITAVEVATWSQRVAITHAMTLPHTLNAGSVNATLSTTSPPLVLTVQPGCPFAQITIRFTTAGVPGTFTFYYAVRLIDPTLDETDFPTEEEYFEDWIFDVYAFGAGVPSAGNPTGVGFGIQYPAGGGHLASMQAYLPTAIAQGLKHCILWQPAGQMHLVDDDPSSSDILFDWWIVAQEYGAANGLEQLYNTFVAALDWMIGQGVTPWIYMGTLRHSQPFLALRDQPGAFGQRILDSISFGIGRQVGFIFDTPASQEVTYDNPLITTGEPRFESLDFIRRIKELQGLATYVEPRSPGDAPQFFGEAGWAHLMIDRSYSRANPSWHPDAGNVCTDAQMAPEPVARWITNGNNDLLPYQLAHIFQGGQQAVAAFSFYWVNAGGTLTDLYGWVKHHVRAIRGVENEIPIMDDPPTTPATPFEVGFGVGEHDWSNP